MLYRVEAIYYVKNNMLELHKRQTYQNFLCYRKVGLQTCGSPGVISFLLLLPFLERLQQWNNNNKLEFCFQRQCIGSFLTPPPPFYLLATKLKAGV